MSMIDIQPEGSPRGARANTQRREIGRQLRLTGLSDIRGRSQPPAVREER